MLEGFESITAPLTDDEKAMVPVFKRCMESNHRGEHRAISAKEICDAFNRVPGIRWDTPRLRKLVSYCTVNDVVSCLVATSKGYYIATDYGECLQYQKSLQGRLEAIQARLEAMKRQTAREFGPKQLQLF